MLLSLEQHDTAGICRCRHGHETHRSRMLRALQVLVADGDPESWELDGIVWKTR